MEIRLATIEDAHAIYEIEQQSFSVPWRLESVLAELEGAANKLYMVICEENHIVGYAGAGLYTMKVKLRILPFCLLPVVKDTDQNLQSN